MVIIILNSSVAEIDSDNDAIMVMIIIMKKMRWEDLDTSSGGETSNQQRVD